MNQRTLISGFAAIMVLAAPAMASAATPAKAPAAATANCKGLTGNKLQSCTAKLHSTTAVKTTKSMAAPVKPVKKY